MLIIASFMLMLVSMEGSAMVEFLEIVISTKTWRMNFPPPGTLPGTNTIIPYHFVADDAFALSERIMKPYPNRGLSSEKLNFNSRLSRARRVSENAFGILVDRFRVLLSPINLSPTKLDTIVLTIVALHNYLASTNKTSYIDASENLKHMPRLHPDPGQRSTTTAQQMRQCLTQYFNNQPLIPK